MSARRVRSLSYSLVTHRTTAALGVAFTLLHVVALLADNFVDIGWFEVLIPLTTVWRPGPVAWGVVGLYLLVLVEGTSLLRRHLPSLLWRRIHLNSYLLFAVITIHFLSAGTDVHRWVPQPVAIALGSLVLAGTGWAYVRADRQTDPARGSEREPRH